MSESSMVHDHLTVAVLATGFSGTVLAVAVAPWLGLVPPLITGLIYLHRVWTRRKDRQLRDENDRLRRELEKRGVKFEP